MSDKFEKLSIYDVDVKLEDENGEEYVFTFKPLPFSTYPRVYNLLSKFNDMDGANDKDFIKMLDTDTMKELTELELEMVKISYPDMDITKAEKFVISNVFNLIEVLISLTFKQEKGNPRKTAQSLKNE